MTDWIDTHAHLDDRKFDADREAVLSRARQVGVRWIVTVGADLPSSRMAVILAERFEDVYATVGVHPHDACCVDQVVLDELRDLALHPRVVAVGEIGLDYYRDLSPRDAQLAAFEAQLALATEVDKPVVIHLRDKRGHAAAYERALTLLCTWISRSAITQSHPHGVLHCFSGTPEIAQAALDLGFCLGIDGPVTYPNARGLQTLVSELPLKRLLLETDCPWLAPQVRRGKRNEPAYLPYIGQKVAELKGIDLAEVAQVTTANAQRLFRLKP